MKRLQQTCRNCRWVTVDAAGKPCHCSCRPVLEGVIAWHERHDYEGFHCSDWSTSDPAFGWSLRKLDPPIIHEELVEMSWVIEYNGRAVGLASHLDIVHDMLDPYIGQEQTARLIREVGSDQG